MKNDTNTLIWKLEDLLKHEQEKLCAMQIEAKKIHGGSLYIRKRENRVSFAEFVNGKEYGIGKEKDRVYELARKQVLQQRIDLSSAGCRALEDAVKSVKKAEKRNRTASVAAKLELLQLAGMHPEKVYWDSEKYDWMTKTFESNPYMPETLKYATMRGIRMRSKSERTIGSRLEQRGILYHYEQKVIIDGTVCYPDFLIRKESGQMVIWEHMGLMHRKDYFFDAMKKIERYRRAGFVQHKNLICTWEEDLEDIGNIDEIIDRFIIE